jgi:hypothetical protein
MRKSVIDKVGLYNPKFKIAGDFEYFIRLFKNFENSAVYIPKILTLMSLGGKSALNIKNQIIINSEILHACKINSINTNLLFICFRYPIKIKEYLFK